MAILPDFPVDSSCLPRSICSSTTALPTFCAVPPLELRGNDPPRCISTYTLPLPHHALPQQATPPPVRNTCFRHDNDGLGADCPVSCAFVVACLESQRRGGGVRSTGKGRQQPQPPYELSYGTNCRKK